MRDAVDWVLAALSGRVTPEDVAARLAPRLAARGDIARQLAGSPRLAVFREHPAVVEEIEMRRPWAARAVVRTGPSRWEIDVVVEPDPPHLISSFQPRPVAAGAPEWAEIAPAVRRAGSRPAGAISRELAEAVESLHVVGLAAGVAVRGEVVYRATFGLADLASGAALQDNSIFRVGSVTKMVTALAVLLLAREGAVDLDAPADPARTTATVADLLLHRGGLLKDQIRQAWPPGTRAEYSNAGYGLLGDVIEAASGMPYATFCAERVLPRYGLRSAHMQEPGVPAPADVTGYRLAAGRLAPAPPAVAPLPSAGGMTAAVDDLLALAALFARGEDPLARTALDRTTPAGPGVRFAPGFAILDGQDTPVLWRGGATDGFTAEILAALDGSREVVLLTSKSPPDGVRDVALRIFHAI